MVIYSLAYDDIMDMLGTLNRRHRVNATVMNKGQLEAALEKPDLSMFGKVFYPELHQKAAILMESLCKSHCLSDGNKRTSMMAAEYLVSANGATLVLPLKSIRLTVDCAMDKDDKMSDELIMWFKTHIAQDPIQLSIMFEELIEERLIVTTLLSQGEYDKAEKIVDKWLVFDNYPESKAMWDDLMDKWKKRDRSMGSEPGASRSNFSPWLSISPELRIEDSVNLASILPDARATNPVYTEHSMSELKRVENYIQAQSAQSTASSLQRAAGILERFHSHKNACMVYDKLIEVEGRSNRIMHRKLFNLVFSEQYNEALALSNQLLELDQNSVHVNKLRARTCNIMGDRLSALESANRVLKQIPDDLPMLKIKVDIIREDYPSDATKLDREIYRLDPDDLVSAKNMAVSLSDQGRNEEAIKLFDKILSRAPRDAAAHYSKGLCLSRLDKNEDALTYYEKSLQIDPRYVMALINMGAIYMNDDKKNEAYDCLSKALKLSPEHPIGLLNMGVVLLSQENAQESINVLNKLLSVDHLNADGMYLLAQAYVKRDKTVHSLDILERLVNIDPSYKSRIKNDPNFYQLRDLRRFQNL